LPWDIDKENLDEYLRIYYALDNYLEFGVENDDKRRQIADHLRILLEHHMKHRFPTEFIQYNMLGEIINKLKLGTKYSFPQKFIEDLEDINGFSLRYHHSSNNREPIDDSQLSTYVKRTFKIIKSVD
jgi:hypothetical protein